MSLLPSRYRKISRGQALVEFALILPVLAMLLVMALDLGRVYFGWVGLQNAARIGANYAAIHPDAWSGNSPTQILARQQYAQQIAQDASALNCTPVPTTSNVPAPVFTSIGGTSSPIEIGDRASVTLRCTFSLITPLANGIFGGGVPMDATAVFTIRSGTIAGIPVVAALPSAPASVANPCLPPLANFSVNPTQGPSPLVVTFTNGSSPQGGCAINSYLWNFGDGTTSTVANPPALSYTAPGKSKRTYTVSLSATSAGGTSTLYVQYVTVN